MSNSSDSHPSRRLVALAWVVTSIAVLAAAASYDALTGDGFWGTCASLAVNLVCALAALGVEFGVPGARTRVVGSAAATVGAVVALVAVHGHGAAEVVWTGALVAPVVAYVTGT